MIHPEVQRRALVVMAVCASLSVACSRDDPFDGFRSRSLPESGIHLLETSARFSFVRDITVSGEAIWVLDSEPPFLTRLGWDGPDELSLGRRGGGPGEFTHPRTIQPVAGVASDGVRVWDFGAGRVLAFDGAGALKEETRLHDPGLIRGRSDLPEVSFLDPYRIRVDHSIVFANAFDRRLDRTSDLASGALVRASLDLALLDTVCSLEDHVPEGLESLKEWASQPVWDFCQGEVVLWSPRAAKLIWMDPKGEVLRERGMDLPSIPIRLQDIERYLERMARLEMGPDYRTAGIDFAQMARTTRDRFAEDRPGVTGMLCGEEGEVWLRLFDTDPDPLGRGREWLLVRAGEQPSLIRFPRAFKPFRFSRIRALGIVEIPGEGQGLAWMDWTSLE